MPNDTGCQLLRRSHGFGLQFASVYIVTGLANLVSFHMELPKAAGAVQGIKENTRRKRLKPDQRQCQMRNAELNAIGSEDMLV